MGKLKRTSRPGYKARYSAYSAESRADKNRKKKLLRHLKTHEGDGVARAAVDRPSPAKNKPKSSMYPKTEIRELTINKEVKITAVDLSRTDLQVRAKLKRAANARAYKEGTYGIGAPIGKSGRKGKNTRKKFTRRPTGAMANAMAMAAG